MWAFYRREIDQCAAKLSRLHDTSADSRHQLHRKVAGSEPREDVNMSSPSSPTAPLLRNAELQYSPPASRGSTLRPNLQVEWASGRNPGGGRKSFLFFGIDMPFAVVRLISHFFSTSFLLRASPASGPPLRAFSSLRRAPVSLAAAGVADPSAQCRSACARPQSHLEICDEISEKSCPVSVLAHLLPTGLIFRDFFSGTCSLTSNRWGRSATRPASPLWTPAREAACSHLRN